MNVQNDFLLKVNNLLKEERPADAISRMEDCNINIKVPGGWEVTGRYHKQTLISVTLNKTQSTEGKN